MKLWKPRGRVFIKLNSEVFHQIILLKVEIWKLRSISSCICKYLPIFEISKTVCWIFHGQNVIWSAGTAWQIMLSLWKKVYIQPKRSAQIFLHELWNSVKKQKPATNNSNKNAILSPQFSAMMAQFYHPSLVPWWHCHLLVRQFVLTCIRRTKKFCLNQWKGYRWTQTINWKLMLVTNQTKKFCFQHLSPTFMWPKYNKKPSGYAWSWVTNCSSGVR